MSASSKKLRACLVCAFLATPTEFRKEGCPNCEPILEMKGSSDRVLECTTPHFDGAIALIDPKVSWVAKWQRNNKHFPGVYAVRINATLPEAVLEDLSGRGIQVRTRENDD